MVKSMDPSDMQLLVHVSASCHARNDARYRTEAQNLLDFFNQDRKVTSLHPLDRNDVSIQGAEETYNSDLVGTVSESDSTNLRTQEQLPMWQIPGRIRRQLVRSRSDAALHQRTTPEVDIAIQVGRTPAIFTRETPLERPKTAPPVIKETPLGQPLRPTRTLRLFDTPPSTVPDSQPSHSSFKRPFMECAAAAALCIQSDTPLDTVRKRARMEPPVPPFHLIEESFLSNGLRSTRGTSTRHISKRSIALDDGHSSPSPPKRLKAQSEQIRLLSSSNSGAQADAELSSSQSAGAPVIYEDEDVRSPSGPQSTSLHQHESLPLRSSQSSQNRQSSQASQLEPEPDPPISQSSSTKTPTGLEASAALPPSTQPPPPSSSSPPPTAISIPSSQLITAPRPPTSNSIYTTHLTPALSLVRSKLQPLDKYYRPRVQHRPITPLERGCWHLAIPREWAADGTRATFWTRLSEHIRRGRAGWGTWIERCGTAGAKASGEGDVWRVWCWGEVCVEIYLLLYVDSGGKVRGVPAVRWDDGAGATVVEM